jgi:hypothetical protein
LRVDLQLALKAPAVYDGGWPAMTYKIVSHMACQFGRQVYGIEIEFA